MALEVIVLTDMEFLLLIVASFVTGAFLHEMRLLLHTYFLLSIFARISPHSEVSSHALVCLLKAMDERAE